jgi:hypothetical protein
MNAPSPQHEPDRVDTRALLIAAGLLVACTAGGAVASRLLLDHWARGRPPVRSPAEADLAAFRASDQWLRADRLLREERARPMRPAPELFRAWAIPAGGTP